MLVWLVIIGLALLWMRESPAPSQPQPTGHVAGSAPSESAPSSAPGEAAARPTYTPPPPAAPGREPPPNLNPFSGGPPLTFGFGQWEVQPPGAPVTAPKAPAPTTPAPVSQAAAAAPIRALTPAMAPQPPPASPTNFSIPPAVTPMAKLTQPTIAQAIAPLSALLKPSGAPPPAPTYSYVPTLATQPTKFGGAFKPTPS